jgi:hypothetical protein
MSVSFQDLQEALTLDDKDEFIIWQNSSKRNKRVKRGNLFASKGLTVKGKFIDVESGNDVGLAAAAAANDAAVALATAEGAQLSANGKNRIFYQSSEPTSGSGGTSGYALIENDLWFDTDGGYRMAKWNGTSWEDYGLETEAIANLDAGKITAGFIGAQVININGSEGGGISGTAGAGGYIESTNFVPSWVSGALTVRQYTTSGTYGAYLGKHIPSDAVQVKVLQGDGKYKLFRSLQNQGENATNAPPSSGNNSYWQEITGANIPVFEIELPGGGTKQIQNFGFRIVSNGYAEFGGSLFRGAVIANEGFFGTTSNAVRLDDDGLTVGDYGRLKSASLGYNGTSFFVNSGTSGGFFLGNTQAEGGPALYQLYIGSPAGNNLWWNGTSLIINGKIGLPDGGDQDSDAGLEITSGFGIRRSTRNKVLTITGGDGNGVTFGSQIDLVGTQFMGAGGGAEGQLILSGGYDATLDPVDPSRDGCIIFRTAREEDNENIGAVRARIDLDGTFRIIAADNVYSEAPNDGAGNLIVDNEVEAIAYNSTSSKRFKKKIKNLKNGLTLVKSLRPVTFEWKNKKRTSDLGLIAEEVNEILPMVVGKNTNGEISSLDYGKLTTILIQAVKELSVEVEKLKSKIG